ncbi:hypothetical protein [Streptobacillus moniliformis]|uniref:Alkaline shock response membrane anchor protein AmaP n=1 Tax=Streptobacillus moniliformis (strain ATCC 14647 / DSM 12112 / NCTC 10651 / 9901) TaxID=519441 RepID=D1AVZ5_STRM9|nr:hypothetical protein [Streptobacillus moniliformis]ACZ01905.1 hypothetical protein Smon_1472 [Streptobacillus moniliformis DSM 12112]AVL43107.1 hypothetical protein CEP89_04375 [Streptobacillus moniliformis]QXW65246.1 hypothetical protein KX935_05365 [Streptobacillus moniliformis]SQA12889.1 Uncharacterised protein [Streptobacillus moniliformis]
MFRFLSSLIKVIVFLSLPVLGFMTISDTFFYTTYFDEVIPYVIYLRFVGFLAIGYLIIFLLSLLEKLFKKTKVVKSQGKDGKIEVDLNTINDISKIFLEQKSLIKTARVVSHSYFSKILISANVETYNIENLNDRLSVVQNELKEYINLMTGVVVKDVSLKIVKINQEKIFDTVTVEDVNLNDMTDEEIVETTPEF